MDWTGKNGGIDLTSVTTKGLPTLGVGRYTGYLTSITTDAEGKQWICLTTYKGSHLEQSDLDVDIEHGAEVLFEIATQDGAIARLKGNKYRLEADGEPLTDWISLPEIYLFVQENDVQLAEPKLRWLKEKKL